MAERTLACAAETSALLRKPRYDGTAIATRMPRMMMTTSSSIRVNPCSLAIRFLILLITSNSPWKGVGGGSQRPRVGYRGDHPPAVAPNEGYVGDPLTHPG